MISYIYVIFLYWLNIFYYICNILLVAQKDAYRHAKGR